MSTFLRKLFRLKENILKTYAITVIDGDTQLEALVIIPSRSLPFDSKSKYMLALFKSMEQSIVDK